MRHRFTLPALALTMLATLAGAVLPGCSGQQLYGAGQAWQRQECSRVPDAEERRRCMASTQGSYEAYKQEADAAKGRRP